MVKKQASAVTVL